MATQIAKRLLSSTALGGLRQGNENATRQRRGPIPALNLDSSQSTPDANHLIAGIIA